MKNMKRMTGLLLCLAMLAGFAACGSKQEETQDGGSVTETVVSSERAEDTSGTEEETQTTEASKTKETEETTETTSDETKESTSASAATTAVGTTAAPAADTTEAPAPNHNDPEPATNAPTDPPTEAPTAAPNDAPEMSFTFGSGTLNIGDSAQGFTAAEPFASEEKSPSCLGNGEDINYYYNDFTLYVWNDNGSYQTIGIDISGAGASTSRGITIGSTAEEVTAAYGLDYTEENSDFVYRYDGDCSLRFTMNGGVVTFISYNKDIQ